MKRGFVHIPKTGGSSFILHFDSIAPGRIRRCGVFEFLNFIDSVGDEQVIYGHIPAFLFTREAPSRSLHTILRDPMRRAISTYLFILTHPGHRMHRHIAARKFSLADCYNHPILRHEMGNLQTKMLGWRPEREWKLPALDVRSRLEFEHDYVSYLMNPSTPETLACAKERLSSIHFAVLERPQTVLDVFAALSDVPITAIPVLNVTPPHDYQVTEEDRVAIAANTRLDRELYEFAVSSLK
jgi:hypothetical protein